MMSYSLQVAGRSRVVVGRTVEELPRLLPQGRVVVLTDRNVARCRPELFEDCDPICMEAPTARPSCWGSEGAS